MAEKLVKWGTVVLFTAIGVWMFNQNILNMFPTLISWLIGGFLLLVASYLVYTEVK